MTDAELALKIDGLVAELGKRELSLEQWLADSGQSLASLRFNLRWEDVWARYIAATITDNAEWKAERPGQFECADAEIVDRIAALPAVRAYLDGGT